MKTLKSWLVSTRKQAGKLFTFSGRLTGVSTLRRRPKPETYPSNIFHRCNELSLDRFIACTVDHDYNQLIKYGTATRAQLLRAWKRYTANIQTPAAVNHISY